MRRSRSNKAITLLELLIVVAIIGVLFAIMSAAVGQSLAAARATVCMANQRQIGLGLQLYNQQNNCLPGDAEAGSLHQALEKYIPDEEVFKCPCDKEPNSVDSYYPYYVSRGNADEGQLFVIGCPRHKQKGTALFSNSTAFIVSLGEVKKNGSTIQQDASESDRTLTSGSFQFSDGSTVDASGSSGSGKGKGKGPEDVKGPQVTVLESFRYSDGTLYTVVRMSGDGKLDVTVTPGSKFEVVTPSAIIAVRGTQFTVQTVGQGKKTNVKVSKGKVLLQARRKGKGKGLLLGPGQSGDVDDT